MRLSACLFAACFGLLAVTLAPPSHAQSQIESYVAQELPRVLPNVDVSRLSQHQISSLYMLLSSEESAMRRRSGARSIVFGLGRVFQGLPRQFP